MSTKYRQCKLVRYTEHGTCTTVSYLPDKHAKVGECVKLRGVDGKWRNGYHVTSAGPLTESEYVEGLYCVGADFRKKLK